MNSFDTQRIHNFFADSYALLDCGELQKLERFSDKIIARPSSLCIWKKKLPKSSWDKADAVYSPKKGWLFQGKQPFESWTLQSSTILLKLRLQSNGQVGIFPEHAYYLNDIRDYLKRGRDNRQEELKVLNLFAYSGMASMLCLEAGAQVCHVDLSKKILSWAKDNAALNDFSASNLRLIPDDALSFLKREARRENKYDVVILDPPSFSRIEGKKSWKLEDVIYDFIENALAVCKKGSLLVFSCHHQALDARVLANILQGELSKSSKIIAAQDLAIPEENSSRLLPAGSVVTCLI